MRIKCKHAWNHPGAFSPENQRGLRSGKGVFSLERQLRAWEAPCSVFSSVLSPNTARSNPQALLWKQVHQEMGLPISIRGSLTVMTNFPFQEKTIHLVVPCPLPRNLPFWCVFGPPSVASSGSVLREHSVLRAYLGWGMLWWGSNPGQVHARQTLDLL